MMSDELAEYRPPSSDLTVNRQTTDDWYDSFPNIVKLAEYVADTEFVPDAMRRKPAAIAAAILTGREMGLPPMVALRHLYVIKGRVGQSAELMRAQVYRAGHEIRYIESTDQRCIVEGRRNTEQDWTRVQFTAQDAKQAGIDLRGYAADKLLARATSRLARRKFPDSVMGLPTIDELEDTSETAAVVELAPTDAPAVQRKRQPRKPKAALTQPPTAPQAAVAAPNDDDDLLDDNATRLEQAKAKAAKAHDVIFGKPEPEPIPDDLATAQTNLQAAELLAQEISTEDNDVANLFTPEEPQPPATRPQHAKIQAIFRELDVTDKADQLTLVSHILRYDFTGSRSLLTKTEANTILDALTQWQTSTDYPATDRINDILNQTALAETEQEEEPEL